MASTIKLMSEEQLLCSICRDLFKEPVSTRCGHNYCKSCITQYWDSSCQIQCPLCRTKFHTRPKFLVNTEFRAMVEHFRHMKVKSEGEIAQAGEVPCDVCTETKIKAHKTCLMDQEAAEMRRKRCELEQLLQTEDHLHFLLSYQRYNQTAAIQSNSIEPLDNKQPVYGEMVKKSTAQMKKTLSAMPKVWIPPQDELMMIQQCNAVDLTFNAFGGHISLMVSRDGKQLSLRNDRFVLSTLFGERFENLPIAFSTNSFSSGRFYYEVRVNKNQNFILGVAKESVNMKPVSYPTTVDGVWTFRLLFGNVYEVFDPNEIRLFLKQAPEVIGVFVDYEKGDVSFYDVEARYLMYSYKGCCFTERLYPIFGFSDDLSNPSLTITPHRHLD
uniref:E3 ubiquitin-protein ligase TRIM39-like n=1 Tax=Oryzias sinensis TaxID=183150 RepID=A0A8C7XXD8_9TELE